MSKSIEPSYMVILHCRHTQIFRQPVPALHTSIYCRRCTEYRSVVRIEREFRVRCVWQGCRINKGFGTDRQAAMRFVTIHLTNFPRHTVTVHEGMEFVGRFGHSERESINSWLARNPDHQRSLRRIVVNATERAVQPRSETVHPTIPDIL